MERFHENVILARSGIRLRASIKITAACEDVFDISDPEPDVLPLLGGRQIPDYVYHKQTQQNPDHSRVPKEFSDATLDSKRYQPRIEDSSNEQAESGKQHDSERYKKNPVIHSLHRVIHLHISDWRLH